MALGGGTWLTQNKILPGSYINFISKSRSSTSLSDRGYVALAIELDWGIDEEIFTVTQEDFQKNSLKIFGYSYDSDKLKGLRDLFKNATVLYAYKLNKGVKASNAYARAKYAGTRGNDLKIVIAANVDETELFDVSTYLGTTLLDTQTVSKTSELVSNNYVDFITETPLDETAGTILTGGTNGEAITGTEYQTFLDKIESYKFNTLGCLSTTEAIKSLFAEFTKRMRDEVGAKFQTVLYQYSKADYEGVISVENSVLDQGAAGSELVYWTLGAEGGCDVNKTCSNKKYDGEYKVKTTYTQTELTNAIQNGKLLFHKVDDTVKVLSDINTFISFTDEKSIDFASNQTIRVLDQIANDTAVLFNTKYYGEIPNDASGRISLWNDICDLDKALEKIRAITDFDSSLVTTAQGNTKKSVVVGQEINVVNAMEQLYMSVVVA